MSATATVCSNGSLPAWAADMASRKRDRLSRGHRMGFPESRMGGCGGRHTGFDGSNRHPRTPQRARGIATNAPEAAARGSRTPAWPRTGSTTPY